jgi:tetratricopeptide (TPR) repeat protein
MSKRILILSSSAILLAFIIFFHYTSVMSSKADNFAIGNKYYDRGELKKAYDSYKKALEKNPGNPKIYEALGETTFDMGKCPESLEYCEKAREMDPQNISNLTNLFWLYYLNSRLENAHAICKDILAIAPNCPFCFTFMADLEVRESLRTKDTQFFKKAEEFIKKGDFSKGETWFVMGKLHYVEGKKQESIQDMERALKIGSFGELDDELDMLYFMGQLYLDINEPEKARDIFHLMLSLFDTWNTSICAKQSPYPEAAMAYLSTYFGEHFEKKQFDKFYKRFDLLMKKGVQERPDLKKVTKLLFNMVDAKQRKDYKNAIDAGNQYIEEMPERLGRQFPSCSTKEILASLMIYQLGYTYLGNIYYEMGRVEDARREYGKALKFEPGNCVIKKKLESL